MVSFKKSIIRSAIALSISAFSYSALANDIVNPEGGVVVGYWHNWCGGAGYQGGTAPCIKLDQVNPMYNVVDVSFMKVYDTAEGRIPTFKLDLSIHSEQEFIDSIKEMNNQGRSVLLALGGADAHIELQKGDEAAFAQEIIRLTDLYGFDGLDIDLEQAAITAADNQTVIPEALKIVKDHYRDQNKNFLITMAPEFPYLVTNGKYTPYITALEGYYDWINPQFYNQGGDGIWVEEENAWIAQNNDDLKKEFIYYMSDSLINGTRGYHKIPHDKLVFGIPTNNDAAATGFVKDPQDLYSAFEMLQNQDQMLRGVMTWSINWDMGQDASGNSYNSQFIKDYGPFIHGQEIPTPEGKPVISGIEDTRIKANSTFDPLAGVTASDDEDGDITSSIIVEGHVDTTTVGVYVLTYRVMDSDDNETVEVRKVEVYDAKPTFTGISDTNVEQGSAFDPMAGVTAQDSDNVDITDQITVEGSVNTEELGTYTLVYRVTDDSGLEATESRNVEVVAAGACAPAWDPAATYVEGDLVSHNGSTWRAGWWTENEEPGTTGEWGVWQKVDDNGCSGDGDGNGGDKVAEILNLKSEYMIDASGNGTITLEVETSEEAVVNLQLSQNGSPRGAVAEVVNGKATLTLDVFAATAGTHDLRFTGSTKETGERFEEFYTVDLVQESTGDYPQYVAGNSYAAGDIVSNAGGNYQCTVAGWCSQGHEFYEPGVGLYWTDAWNQY
ncbi:DUF5011 domain-containing protein [Vibrio sp. Of7-15]|uniref:immunoglobulin-like domain-containing protein n=1 Tax=Vibrio sp. Of7-15 TaxID=2724879 RepID=UPI001EF28DBA|nr:immunoglobulin-like domain-containing protein [Vibrio sp. Of7-15]MCG7496595.1 DUF5011 domain-containing protein [Vibrio sp. Of7-15]